MTPFQQQHAPALSDLLIGRARLGTAITYGDAALILGIHHRSVRTLLDAIGHACQANQEPILTAMVINATTGECGEGIRVEFGVDDPQAERRQCQEWWQQHLEEPAESLARRAARFAAIEIRPDQAAFRRALFALYRGRCTITGCEIPSLLDAAHKPGRDWRAGHNQATDGVLVRADIHRLLDADLIALGEDGCLHVSPVAQSEYGCYDGACWLPQPGG